jgi:CHAT domain-containing protein/tetratricopeptide (TPR) repeat protein
VSLWKRLFDSKSRAKKRFTRLNEQAVQLHQRGEYGQAIEVATQACDLARQRLGETSQSFVASLNNLAALYQAVGDYALAEPLYRQALEILRSLLGEEDQDYATLLNNLGELYHLMGDYDTASSCYQEALEIRRKVWGEEHPDVAGSLNNLARLQAAMGELEAAEPLYRQALDIRRKVLGEEHPDYATSLNNLALVYQAMGRYDAAKPLFEQALEIRRRAQGEEHPHFAASLNTLAGLHTGMGDYSTAEPLIEQALEIRRKALGKDHPSVAASLGNRAGLYMAVGHEGLATRFMTDGHEDLAIISMKEAVAVQDRMIGQVFSIGSESQRMAYLKTLQVSFYKFLSLIYQCPAGSAEAAQAGVDLVLRRKAMGAEALAAQRDAVLGGRYPDLQPQLRALTILRAQIAQKTMDGPGPEGPEAHQQLLAEWKARQERLEADLARKIPEMNLERKLRAADRQAVASALPEGAALVEFVRFHVYDFGAVPARGEVRWKAARYLAFVLPAGEPDSVEMVDLGEAERIEQMIATFRTAVIGEAESRDVYRPALAPARPVTSNGTALRALVFDPLVAALGGRERLFLAPDGDLTRLPFEVLPMDDGRHLIDEYCISYLSTGRDVLRFGALATGQPGDPLVAADPDFDLGLGAGGEPRPAKAAGVRGQQSRDLKRDRRPFDPLGDARVEGRRIARMLGVEPLLGKDVVEGRVKAWRSPRILHIATHGFFLPDQKQDPGGDQLDAWAVGEPLDSGMSRLAVAGLENPLLRSGLALAGANIWLRGDPLPVEAEDGILNGVDVTGLDLVDTDLVVLSACQTGLGEVRAGEGVFGLRRAFALAGAKTLVMSLWKVPDAETGELMEAFYRGVLEGQPRADALRAAQRAMKESKPDPFYWGAFICQGDPGPLPQGR